MSFYLDLLDLLRYLLEYFGVPTDLLVPVWANQLCGQYRSIVRMIGTNLPLSPCPRVCFQKIPDLHAQHSTASTPVSRPFVPSFADVLWVADNKDETCVSLRNVISPCRGERRTNCTPVPPEHISMLSQSVKRVVEKKGNSQSTNACALKKITALEDELSRLRAQIAMIVTTQDQGYSMPQLGFMQPPGTPGMSLLPVLTSTPSCTPAPPPPPSPLPPPPPSTPLPPPSCRTAQVSAGDLIRQRHATNRSRQCNRDKVSVSDSIPSMLDVLKEMNKVRLRAVERSPGGTPVMKKDKKQVSLSDPAALIADALKRKFAHRHKEDSFDKENRSFETSPFGSPETRRIEPCVLKVPGKHIPLKIIKSIQ
ncbi:mitochondrial fission regulator 2 [Polyodon spathula]|uniref:mitochondrial fission regulator 2 n=1 Tax=Polyodon spathula TaxID=7913 RepID=UPI001B7E6A8E|nr:mitochondrial fission regulator 2 [Polyodon spathula]